MADSLSHALSPDYAGVRWSLATVLAAGLHLGALALLVEREDAPAAQAAPEAVVMIDLPPEPELPPIESVEQAAVEEVPTEVAPAMADPAQPVEEIVETERPDMTAEAPQPEMVRPSDQVADVAEASVETVGTAPPPEMVPPSPVALETAEAPVIETVPVKDVKPKPPAKPVAVARKPPPAARPPADAQAAGAGSGKAVEDALMSYRSAIRKAILARKRAADADGAEGRAVVSITIGRDGGVVGLAVSGADDVAGAARRLMQRVGRFPVVPTALSAPFVVTVPVEFQRR